MKMQFYTSVKHLDLVKGADKAERVKTQSLLRDLRSVPAFRYFFYDLENPMFVSREPLRKFMSNALSEESPIRSYYVAQYLKRIATKDSRNVARVLQPSEPRDQHARLVLLRVILDLNINDASKLVRFLTRYLIGKGFNEGDILSNLIAKYLAGGKRKEALLVFDFLTTPVPVPSQRATTSASRFEKTREADALLEQYEYKDLTETAFPKLLEGGPLDVVRILERNLLRALKIETKDNKGSKAEDFSYIWRPAIEDHEQNYDFGKIKELLTSLLRDSLMILSQKEGSEVSRALLARYLKSRFTIFQRMALYVLGERADLFLEDANTILLDKRMLNDYRVTHELFGLMRKVFPKLDEASRTFLLNWIENGPETQSWINWRVKEQGNEPPAEEIESFKNRWRLERYSIIRKDLVKFFPEKVNVVAELEQKLGIPAHPDFPSWHEDVSYGYESPLSVEQILEMGDNELIGALENPPPVSRPDPDYRFQGLGMVFAEAVKQQPERFLPFAARLATKRIVPQLVGHYFQGLRDAWEKPKGDWTPEWSDELTSLAMLVANSDPNPFEWKPEDRSTVRLNLCRFIELVVSDRNRALSDSALTSIKLIAIAMIGDPDPDAAAEEQNYATNRDWPFLALNHTSGIVIHTLVKYALCYARRHPEVGDRFEPDVRSALHKVLEAETRASVFSVFGTYLANLWYLDANWTKSRLDKIFPRENKRKYNAAWDAYLKFNNVYKEVYLALKPQYTLAVATRSSKKQPKEFDIARLSQHLSLVYWREWEDVTESDSVVATFLDKAPISARISFIRQIGMGLREMKKTGELSRTPRAWERAKELWSQRIGTAKSVKGGNRQQDEVSAFLDWLTECPDDVEIMKELISKSLRKWKAQYHSGAVTEYLAAQSVAHPLTCIKLLAAFFRRPWDKSYYHFDEKEVRQVMESALAIGGDAASLAAQLSSKLGEYGRFDFKDIWERVNTFGGVKQPNE